MIEMHMNAQSERLLAKAMTDVLKKTTMSTQKASVKAMYYICRSAAAGVKPKSMKAKRALVTNPNRTGRGKRAKGAKYAIQVLRQSGPMVLVPTNSKTDPRRMIRKLGLAAKAFKLGSAIFGASVMGEKIRSKSKLVSAEMKTSRGSVRTMVEVMLSYIEKAFPSIVPQAMTKGLTSFIHTFDRDWASAIKAGEQA